MRQQDGWSDEAEHEGRYANYFAIGYNAFEFVLDFGQRYIGYEEGIIHTRIITGPAYARALLKTLQGSIEAYEADFGAIENVNGDKDVE